MSNTAETQGQRQAGFNFDRLASVFAVALSIAAILVSVAEVYAVRAQQRAAVWPHLNISESYSEAGFRLRLTNKGVGPALMSDVRLIFDGAQVTDLDKLIIDTLGPEDAFSYDRYSVSNPSNSVVAAGETVTLFAVPWDPQTRKLISLWNGKIDVQTCYCSIHGECWSASLEDVRTPSTETCRTGVSS